MVRLAVVIATVAIPFGCSDDPTLGAPPDEQVQQNLPDPSEAIQKRIEGKTGEALVILRKLKEEHPDSPEILTLLGRTLLDAEEYALAAFRLEQAADLGGNAHTLAEAAQAHVLAEDDGSAEKLYHSYLKQHPEDTFAHI
ncbi:MAG: tetratricopeptide repeat protein, partial [Opitutales bacterium]